MVLIKYFCEFYCAVTLRCLDHPKISKLKRGHAPTPEAQFLKLIIPLHLIPPRSTLLGTVSRSGHHGRAVERCLTRNSFFLSSKTEIMVFPFRLLAWCIKRFSSGALPNRLRSGPRRQDADVWPRASITKTVRKSPPRPACRNRRCTASGKRLAYSRIGSEPFMRFNQDAAALN